MCFDDRGMAFGRWLLWRYWVFLGLWKDKKSIRLFCFLYIIRCRALANVIDKLTRVARICWGTKQQSVSPLFAGRNFLRRDMPSLTCRLLLLA